MLNRIIADRLREHRRLVIPQLGAFIVKASEGEIFFSELLRGDDGVLRELVKANGIGDIEAAGVIDRFVFEVRNTLDDGRPYVIDDIGSLQRVAGGSITFVQNKPAQAAAEPERLAEMPSARSGNAVRALYEADDEHSVAVDDRSAVAEKRAGVSDMRSVVAERQRAAAGKSGGNVAPKTVRRRVRRRGADMFIIVSVIIAALAVAVMVYGYLCAKEQEDVSVREMFIPSYAPSSARAYDEQSYSEPADLSVPSGASDAAK